MSTTDPYEVPPLSGEDQRHLDDLERTLQVVRDNIDRVVDRTATGYYLHGRGGVGKSYTVLNRLDERRADYVLLNSRSTGRALFNDLAARPDAVFVMEDMERLFQQDNALGVIRSALWGQAASDGSGRRERVVTWSNERRRLEVIFTGGLIFVANRPLGDRPEHVAIASRITVQQLQPSQHQVRAKMREIARGGHVHEGHRVAPAACVEVCEFVIREAQDLNRPLDLRQLVNALNAYIQAGEFGTGCSWRDLVAAQLRERPTFFRDEVAVGGREAVHEDELKLVAELVAAGVSRAEQERAYRERTGKSRASFFRRLEQYEQAQARRETETETET